jgi:hypothetical protein
MPDIEFGENRRSPVRITDGTEVCSVCGKKASVIYCDGCNIPLCPDCRKFDLWGYGCGHVDTKAFCPVCVADEKKNPYGGCIE